MQLVRRYQAGGGRRGRWSERLKHGEGGARTGSTTGPSNDQHLLASSLASASMVAPVVNRDGRTELLGGGDQLEQQQTVSGGMVTRRHTLRIRCC